MPGFWLFLYYWKLVLQACAREETPRFCSERIVCMKKVFSSKSSPWAYALESSPLHQLLLDFPFKCLNAYVYSSEKLDPYLVVRTERIYIHQTKGSSCASTYNPLFPSCPLYPFSLAWLLCCLIRKRTEELELVELSWTAYSRLRLNSIQGWKESGHIALFPFSLIIHRSVSGV